MRANCYHGDMKMRISIRHGFFAVALLAITAVSALGWFNWWLRFGWDRLYPICFDGDQYMQVTEPLTPEATRLFVGDWSDDDEKSYIHINNGVFYTRNWYWLFGEPEIVQVTNAVFDEIIRSRGLDPKEPFCGNFGEFATVKGDYPNLEEYPSNWTQDMLMPLSFDIRRERFGDYSLVGKFYRMFEDDDR